MNNPEILDLRGVPCPRNSARALIRLAGMNSGELLTIIVDEGEPLRNLTSALEAESFVIVSSFADGSLARSILVRVA